MRTDFMDYLACFITFTFKLAVLLFIMGIIALLILSQFYHWVPLPDGGFIAPGRYNR